MNHKISAVINTLNEEKNIKRVLRSLFWVDEMVVCDMYSDDKTVSIAKKMGAKIYYHKRVGYVEPARNFAISKAEGDWILIIDADEEVSKSLADELKKIAQRTRQIDYVRIPRKNIIFNKWMKASMWWPDYNIRFFKKGKVIWTDQIHIPPETTGSGIDLKPCIENALMHYHYETISQYISRLNNYTSVEAEDLFKQGIKFQPTFLLRKPLNEFLGRFFANRGFEDGLHGLALSFLQAFSFLIVYLKLWEKEKFAQKEINLNDLRVITKDMSKEINYWFKYGDLPKNPIKRFVIKIKNRLSK